MKPLLAFPLVLLITSGVLYACNNADGSKIVIKIDDGTCTIAASDATPCGTIRSVIAASKSLGDFKICVTDEPPEKIKITGQYLQVTWRKNGELDIKATGETRHSFITTISKQLATKEGDLIYISVLSAEASSDSNKK